MPEDPQARGSDSPSGRSRGRAILRLVMLVGGPLLVLFSIFSSGVYCGAAHSSAVVGFEEKLGVDPPSALAAKVEGESDAGDESGSDEPNSGDPQAGDDEPGSSDKAADRPTAKTAGKPTGKPTGKPGLAPPTEPTVPSSDTTLLSPRQTPQTSPPDGALATLPLATADPLTTELGEALAQRRSLAVLILVDPALVATQDNWLMETQRLVVGASDSFEVLFGVELRLQGALVWTPDPTADPASLLADLEARERHGADLVIGLLARSRPDDWAPETEPKDPALVGRDSDRIGGSSALVFADLARNERYYQSFMRTLAGLLGATPVTDPSSEAWLRGSFMRDAPPNPGSRDQAAAPWLDAQNRTRVITTKHRRFRGEP